MRKTRERGSISLYVAVCLVSLGMVTGTLVPLAMSYGVRTTRRSDEMRARTAFEAGVAQLKSKSLAMTLVVPSTLSVTMNGASGTVAVAANDAQLAKSLLVTGTMVVKGQSYRYSRVVGARQPSPFLFAISTKGDANFPKAITLGASGWGGDVFSNGKFTIGGAGAGSQINGSLLAVGAISVPSGTTITGQTLTGQATIAWPTPTASNYQSAATTQLMSGNGLVVFTNANLSAVTFPSWSFSGGYAMWYYGGNVTLSGTISGRGTLFVKGNLTISGNLRYATSSDEIAIVVQGDVNVQNGASLLDGYYFVGGNFNAPQPFSLTRGGIAATNFATPQPFSVVRDDAVMNDTNEAVRLRLPYYWP